MKKYKKLIGSFTLMISLTINNASALAGIPGITEPYDPPNYYSKENVSIPDSAPSPFALMDLARNGFQIHDYTNNKKNIISNIKTYTDYLQIIQAYLMDIGDLTHLDIQGFQNDVSAIKGQLSELTQFGSRAKLDEIDKHLYNYSTIMKSHTQKDIPLEDKYKYLENIYETALSISQNEIYSYEDRTAILKKTIDTLNSVQSNMQGIEANSMMNTLNQMEEMRKQQLIAALTALETASIKDKKDDELRLMQENYKFFNVMIEDPYNPSDYYKKNYQRPTGKGFVDFE